MHYDECSILLKKLNYPSTSSTCRRAIYSYALKSQQPERTRQTKNLTRTLDTGEGVKETPGKTSNTPTTAAYIYIGGRKEDGEPEQKQKKTKLREKKPRSQQVHRGRGSAYYGRGEESFSRRGGGGRRRRRGLIRSATGLRKAPSAAAGFLAYLYSWQGPLSHSPNSSSRPSRFTGIIAAHLFSSPRRYDFPSRARSRNDQRGESDLHFYEGRREEMDFRCVYKY